MISIRLPSKSLHEEQPVSARRLLRRADDLDAFAHQVVVPLPDAADVEADVRQADPVPHDRLRRLLRLEVEDLDHRAARNADPADLAGGAGHVDAEEPPHAVGRRVGDADERAAEHVPVEAARRG